MIIRKSCFCQFLLVFRCYHSWFQTWTGSKQNSSDTVCTLLPFHFRRHLPHNHWWLHTHARDYLRLPRFIVNIVSPSVPQSRVCPTMSTVLIGSDFWSSNEVISILFLAMSVASQGLEQLMAAWLPPNWNCLGVDRLPPPDPAPTIKRTIRAMFEIIQHNHQTT